MSPGKKCAHPGCECQVSGDSRYCSQACQNASGDTGSCGCGHADCSAGEGNRTMSGRPS